MPSGRPSSFARTPEKDWGGLDYLSKDEFRSVDFATDSRNCCVSKNGTLTRRPGYEAIASVSAGLGLGLYQYTDTTGGVGGGVIVVGQYLYKLSSGSIAITCIAAGDPQLSMLVDDDNHWHAKLFLDGIEQIDFDCGTGIDEGAPRTVYDLYTTIDAHGSFTATLTGEATTPAAYVLTRPLESFVAAAASFSFYYPTLIDTPTGWSQAPFAGLYTNHTSGSTYSIRRNRCVSYANARKCIYFSSPHDDVVKYDNRKAYRPGVPTGEIPTPTVVPAATGRTGTNIRYRMTYKQVDFQGNTIEGIISEASAAVSPAADTVSLSVTPILATTGYNTDAAMAAGTQTTVNTFNVDNGAGGAHTIKAGDIIYFYDDDANAHTTRTVTSVTSSTLTFSGATAGIADNDPISANLRICIYVQQVADGEYYLIDEFPNNPFFVSQTILDTGQTLGAQYLTPDPGTENGPVPRGRFITAYKNMLYIGGPREYPDRVYRSNLPLGDQAPEGFAPEANFFDLPSNPQRGSVDIGGFADAANGLFIGGSSKTTSLTLDADLATATIRQRLDENSNVIGPITQLGNTQIEDGSVMALGDLGVYYLAPGAPPKSISDAVGSLFQTVREPTSLSLRAGSEDWVFEQGLCAYDSENKRYILYVPSRAFVTASGTFIVYANSESLVLAFEVLGGRWWRWDNMNCAGGLVYSKPHLYFVERRDSPALVTVGTVLYRTIETGTEYDHTDATFDTEWSYDEGWKHGGSPSAYKEPLKLKLHSNDKNRQWPFTVSASVQANFRDDFVVSQMDYTFNEDGGGYGLDPYGDSYGSLQDTEKEIRLQSTKCQAFRSKLTSNERYRAPLLTAWEYEMKAPYKPHMDE